MPAMADQALIRRLSRSDGGQAAARADPKVAEGDD
jgi:hypothetical protein